MQAWEDENKSVLVTVNATASEKEVMTAKATAMAMAKVTAMVKDKSLENGWLGLELD